MKPKWVIETRVDGLSVDRLQTEITKQGLESFTIRPNLESTFPNDILGVEHIPFDDNVIFTGTLDLFQYIKSHRNWNPTGWCDFTNLSCSVFYEHFETYLLNQEYQILPISDAIAQESNLYRSLAVNHKLFVRPDSVDKLFNGQIVDIDSFSEFLSAQTKDQARRVLIGKPMPIQQEWRLFIANDHIVDGCQYFLGEDFDYQPGIPECIRHFVSNVFDDVQWRPDSLFVMDVCDSNNDLRIIEFNSYNCSGLLKCDVSKFVSVATENAMAALQRDAMEP